MFGLAERGNFHGNLTDSIKVVIGPHEVLLMRILLLTLFLSNDVENNVLTSFFNVNFIDRVLNDFLIMLIDINDDIKNRIIFNYYNKNCNHFINHLLSLMNLILKLGENIGMLHE